MQMNLFSPVKGLSTKVYYISIDNGNGQIRMELKHNRSRAFVIVKLIGVCSRYRVTFYIYEVAICPVVISPQRH
jgi:hypothetical protein